MGTTTLFAAFDIATGKVTGRQYKRRRRLEFLDFMNRVVAQNAGREIHVILDNLNMAIAEGFRRLSRIGLDEAAIRVRQVHAKIIKPDLLARDIAIRLAKIRLPVTWEMAQRHEHLAGAQQY
jgi:hypothetical protein